MVGGEDVVAFMGKLFVVGRPGKVGRWFRRGLARQIDHPAHVAVRDVPRAVRAPVDEVGFVCWRGKGVENRQWNGN